MKNEEIKEKKEIEIPLSDLIIIIWKNKILISIITFIFAISSIVYVLVVDEEYKVTCLINPAEPSDELLVSSTSMFGGFSLAGQVETPIVKLINLSLNSKDFLMQFYIKYKDNEVMFKQTLKDIDLETKYSIEERELKKIETFIEILREDIIRFSVNGGNNTISISIVLTDKLLAYQFLNEILDNLKNYIKNQNVAIINEDIAFYKSIISSVTDIKIQNSINQTLSNKITKSIQLSSNLYSIVEKPSLPHKRIFPKRSITVIIITTLGGFLGILVVFLIPFIIEIKNRVKNSD